MRVLVVENYDGTALGQLASAFEEAGAEIDHVRAHHGDALPGGPEEHDAMVVLGGGQNALADGDYPHLPELCRLMRAFGDADRSVLGICLGSQLLARAYGGKNVIGGATEFGWHPVELTDSGRADPVFAGVPASFPIFQWHDDTFGLPPGAVRLAGSGTVANQAFRIGRAAYGVQFHFEADRALVETWSQAFADLLDERQPDWARRHPVDAATLGLDADAVGHAIARGWLSTIGA